MKIAFQLDHPSRLNPHTDTSLMLLEEAARRGHTCFFYEASQLSWREGELTAPLAPLALNMNTQPMWQLGEAVTQNLKRMDVVLMRQDPPFDMGYITATHLLEQLSPSVLVLNDPASVRNAPEKLSILPFSRFMPPTLISIDPLAIHAFAATHGALVAKPLYGYGGRSVFKLSARDANIETLIEHWSERSREPLMWQQFLPEVRDADRRILFINGEVVSVFGRTPMEDSIRANMRVGGQPIAATLSKKQAEICAALSPFLKENKLALAGIDVIGDFLTEINVTSPTGFRAAQKLYGVNLAVTFWDKLEAGAFH